MEPKQVKSGAAVKQERASREVDASEGTSKHRRVKQKRASRTQSQEHLGGSESRVVKSSRIDEKKKEKKHVTRLQTGTDISEADLADCHQVKRKRVGEGSLSWMHSDEQMGLDSGSHLIKCKRIKKKHASREQQKTNVSVEETEISQVERDEVEEEGFQLARADREATKLVLFYRAHHMKRMKERRTSRI